MYFARRVNVERRVSQNSHEVFNVSSVGCVSEDFERDCERSEQHFRSKTIVFSCSKEYSGIYGEVRFGTVLCYSGSEW